MKRLLRGLLLAWTAFWLLLFVVAVAAVALRRPVKDSSILRVRFDGPIAEGASASLRGLLGEGEMPTLRALCEAIRFAATDKRIKGLVLEVDSPEVGIATVQEVEEAMAAFRASGKWNVAFLETAGELGSGDAAYALAVTADDVVLSPAGDANLTGMRVTVPFLKGAFDKLNIQPYFDKRYDYKTAANAFTQSGFTPAHKESLVSLVDDLQSSLVSHLATRRKQKPEDVWRWIKGGVHPADEAEKLGMVDRLAYWDTVADEANALSGRDTETFIDIETYAPNVSLHEQGPAVALIYATGEIHRGESAAGLGSERSTGSDTLVAAFREARAEAVRGIVLRVDSPGGSAVASDVIRREVEACHAAKIPVVVSMGSYAASGGYFVALDADRIVAEPGTITGSIGVFAGTFATRAFFEKFLGVTFGVYETAPEAAHFGGIDALDARTKKQLGESLDRIYKDFVTKVAAGRKKSYAEIHAVAQGRVWSGRAALERGLVDELGGLELALTRVRELAGLKATEPVSVHELPAPKTRFEMLAQALESRAALALPSRLASALAAVRAAARPLGEQTLALPFRVELGD